MKKLIPWTLILVLLICIFSGCIVDKSPLAEQSSDKLTEDPTSMLHPSKYRVALMGYGLFDDGYRFNADCYEALKTWCENNGTDYNYYNASEDSTAGQVAVMDRAIEDGYNVLILPGNLFANAIRDSAEAHPDVYYIGIDICQDDFGDYRFPKNVCSFTYREEVAAFLAGYATAKMGYSDLAVIGTAETPVVMRYMNGFAQGVDYAAKKMKAHISMKCLFAQPCSCCEGQIASKEHLQQALHESPEVVFFCGLPSYYTIPIGSELRQSFKCVTDKKNFRAEIESLYGEGSFLTSALSNYSLTISDTLSMLIKEDRWTEIGGTIQNLGLVSAEDLSLNYVGLPESTQWNDSFTQEDYVAIVRKLLKGKVQVSDSMDAFPGTKHVSVEHMDP